MLQKFPFISSYNYLKIPAVNNLMYMVIITLRYIFSYMNSFVETNVSEAEIKKKSTIDN